MNLAFLCSFCNIFTLYLFWKNVGKLTLTQTSTNPHKSLQVSGTLERSLSLFVLLWRTKWVSLNVPIRKTPNSSKRFCLPIQYSVHCKMEGWKKFTYIKREVQSRDRANMTLVFVQQCNSSQVFYHFVPALLQRHHVIILQVVGLLGNDEIRTSSISHHNQWFRQT